MKYTKIVISSTIYVSSTCHYFATVFFLENGVSKRATLCIPSDLDKSAPLPAYAKEQIKRQIRHKVEAGEMSFHEYDKEGNKRWENLRYYDPEVMPEMVKDWPQ